MKQIRLLDALAAYEQITENMSLSLFGVALLASLLAALLAAGLYRFFYESRGTGSQVARAFPLLALAITTLFVCIQVSIPLSLGLLGSLSIIRFRTPIKEPEEVGFIMLVIASSVAAATYNFMFLALRFAFATASLFAARRLRAGGFLKRDGLIVVTVPAGGAFSAEELSALLRRHVRRHAVQSVGVQNGKVSVQVTFSGLKTEAVRLQDEIARAFAAETIHCSWTGPAECAEMRPGAARCLRWLGGLGGWRCCCSPLRHLPGGCSTRRRNAWKRRARAWCGTWPNAAACCTRSRSMSPCPRNSCRGGVVFSGTVAGPGRFGRARKFDGRERTQIETPLRWDKIGRAFTLSFWVNVSPGRSEQCIWYRAAQGVQVGFHLEEGRMTFDVPSAAGRQSVSYPFGRYGTFVHLAATVDADRGSVALYENGRRMAESSVQSLDLPRANLAFGKHVWYANRDPFRGWVDEATVWGRVLPEKEIRRLARARRGVLWTAGGSVRYLKWRFAQGWARAVRAWAGWPDGLAALTGAGRGERLAIGRLPEIKLIVSGKVRRELLAAHRRSQQSGRRTQAGARRRPGHGAFAGQVHPAWISLAGGDMEYAEGARAGYVVELQDDARILGARRLLLQPPEGGAWLYPLADGRLRTRLGLPAVSNGLCRVSLQGWNLGTFLYSNHDRGGFLPGDARASATDGVRVPLHWNLVFRQLPTPEWRPADARAAWPLSARETESLYDAVVDEWGGCLLGDLQNPRSRK
jgi:hypothetical protein